MEKKTSGKEHRNSMPHSLIDNDDYQLWLLIHQTRDVINRVRENDVSRHGISTVQGAVLFVIAANGGQATATTISRWLLREQHTVSSTISRMTRDGLVYKVKNPERHGELTVGFTEKGKEAARNLEDIEIIKSLFSVISKEECRQLSNQLKKIRDKALTFLSVEKIAPFP
jgi:DNA-binding MarR family transcriptional regulator